MRLGALVVYFLGAPALVAWGVVRAVQHRAAKSGVAPRDAVRQYGRWLAIPWLVYGADILAAAALLELSPSRVGTIVSSPFGAALLVGIGLLPTLLIAMVVRTWARSLGHPVGDVPIAIDLRGWFAQAAFVVLLLAAAFALFAYVGRAAAAVGALLLVTLNLVLFQDLVRWIWRTTPLPDNEQGRRLRALLARLDVSVQRILVIPTSNAAAPNAFVSGVFDGRRYLFVAERLLKELPSDEVDAVVAHEIGHLVYRHVGRIAAAALMTSVVSAALFMGLVSIGLGHANPDIRRPFFALGGAGTVLATLYVTRRMLRRFELEADQFAARTLGSPQPMAHALRAIARANWLPEDIHEAGAFASHPTIRRRLEHLDALGALSK